MTKKITSDQAREEHEALVNLYKALGAQSLDVSFDQQEKAVALVTNADHRLTNDLQ